MSKTDLARADRRLHAILERIADRHQTAADQFRALTVKPRTVDQFDDLPVYADTVSDALLILRECHADLPLALLVEYAADADRALRTDQ